MPRNRADIAAPTATGKPAPTIANAPIRLREKSVRCIEPPTPPQQPLARPMSSPNAASIGTPRASACP